MIASGSMYELYQSTLPIVGTVAFMMGFTLIVLCLSNQFRNAPNRLALFLIAIAALALSAINFAEYLFGVDPEGEFKSLSIVLLASSVEMFLFLFAYVSLLDRDFVTLKRTFAELVLIAVFTVPPLLISREVHRTLVDAWFIAGMSYYVVKLGCNFVVFKKYLHRVAVRIENFHSDGSVELLDWIRSTFYVVMIMGVVSMFVPLTGITVLLLYNILSFMVFLYIYGRIIQNIALFEVRISAMVASDENRLIDTSLPTEHTPLIGSGGKSVAVSMEGHEKAFSKWMAGRAYANPGITADDVASQLNTNRTKLSLYLNNELGMNYYEWIARMRIEDAKKQLTQNPDKPILDIALSVGIGDRSNFDRLFKRFTGVSPAAYRKFR